MSFCVACGRMLDPAATSAPSEATAPPAAASGRPVGKTVAPWLVILLTVVTLGVYPFFLWWRASREVDAFADARSHALVLPGVLIGAAAAATSIVLAGMAFGDVFSAIFADPENVPDGEIIAAQLAGSPIHLVAVGLGLVGAAFLYAGLARMWGAMLREEERLARPERTPVAAFLTIGISAAVASALSSLLAAWAQDAVLGAVGNLFGVVSFALGIAMLWVMYATQRRLNALWRAAQGW
jgi:hypothetical protein